MDKKEIEWQFRSIGKEELVALLGIDLDQLYLRGDEAKTLIATKIAEFEKRPDTFRLSGKFAGTQYNKQEELNILKALQKALEKPMRANSKQERSINDTILNYNRRIKRNYTVEDKETETQIRKIGDKKFVEYYTQKGQIKFRVVDEDRFKQLREEKLRIEREKRAERESRKKQQQEPDIQPHEPPTPDPIPPTPTPPEPQQYQSIELSDRHKGAFTRIQQMGQIKNPNLEGNVYKLLNDGDPTKSCYFVSKEDIINNYENNDTKEKNKFFNDLFKEVFTEEILEYMKTNVGNTMIGEIEQRNEGNYLLSNQEIWQQAKMNMLKSKYPDGHEWIYDGAEKNININGYNMSAFQDKDEYDIDGSKLFTMYNLGVEENKNVYYSEETVGQEMVDMLFGRNKKEPQVQGKDVPLKDRGEFEYLDTVGDPTYKTHDLSKDGRILIIRRLPDDKTNIPNYMIVYGQEGQDNYKVTKAKCTLDERVLENKDGHYDKIYKEYIETLTTRGGTLSEINIQRGIEEHKGFLGEHTVTEYVNQRTGQIEFAQNIGYDNIEERIKVHNQMRVMKRNANEKIPGKIGQFETVISIPDGKDEDGKDKFMQIGFNTLKSPFIAPNIIEKCEELVVNLEEYQKEHPDFRARNEYEVYGVTIKKDGKIIEGTTTGNIQLGRLNFDDEKSKKYIEQVAAQYKDQDGNAIIPEHLNIGMNNDQVIIQDTNNNGERDEMMSKAPVLDSNGNLMYADIATERKDGTRVYMVKLNNEADYEASDSDGKDYINKKEPNWLQKHIDKFLLKNDRKYKRAAMENTRLSEWKIIEEKDGGEVESYNIYARYDEYKLRVDERYLDCVVNKQLSRNILINGKTVDRVAQCIENFAGYAGNVQGNEKEGYRVCGSETTAKKFSYYAQRIKRENERIENEKNMNYEH